MSCEQVSLSPLHPASASRLSARLRRLVGVAALLLSGGVLGCSGQELLGDYAGSHSMIYELESSTQGMPNEILPIEYMGIISVYRQGDAMEIDLSKTCTLKGSQTARNGISLVDDPEAKCMMKLRNIPSRCRASGNIPDVRLNFKSPMRIYLTKNQEITLEGEFEFHATEAVPCREAFVKASYSFKGTASQL